MYFVVQSLWWFCSCILCSYFRFVCAPPLQKCNFNTWRGSDSTALSGPGIGNSNTGRGTETSDLIIIKFLSRLGVFESSHMPVLMTIGAGILAGSSGGRIFPLPLTCVVVLKTAWHYSALPVCDVMPFDTRPLIYYRRPSGLSLMV